MIGQDLNYDKTSLYQDMLISYRWLDNVQEYSAIALQAMQTKFTKKHSLAKFRQRMASNRMSSNMHNMSPQSFEMLVASMQKSSQFGMSIEMCRPFGQFTVLKVVLERTLRAVIVLRGAVFEWVLVKGFDETFDRMTPHNLSKHERRNYLYGGNATDPMDDTLDIWTPSRYKIFRTITDHASAAILHFYSPSFLEHSFKIYLVGMDRLSRSDSMD